MNGDAQAFPHVRHCSERGNDWQETVEGMTLRAYIATKAMQGMLAYPGDEKMGSWHTNAKPTSVAAMAVEYADALLAALEGGK
jgi:hypothetical protein